MRAILTAPLNLEIMEDKFKNDPWGEFKPINEEDKIAQQIFGVKYFNWLSDWEKFHLVHKYKLDEKLLEK